MGREGLSSLDKIYDGEVKGLGVSAPVREVVLKSSRPRFGLLVQYSQYYFLVRTSILGFGLPEPSTEP